MNIKADMIFSFFPVKITFIRAFKQKLFLLTEKIHYNELIGKKTAYKGKVKKRITKLFLLNTGIQYKGINLNMGPLKRVFSVK